MPYDRDKEFPTFQAATPTHRLAWTDPDGAVWCTECAQDTLERHWPFDDCVEMTHLLDLWERCHGCDRVLREE